MHEVPFNRPFVSGFESKHLSEAIELKHFAGDGPATARATDLIRAVSQVPHALLTTSCTHALEMSSLLLDLGPEDEVIVPDFTFVSTANAVALRGAKVVFADIREDTFCLDERLLDDVWTTRTRAVFTVHYGGVGSEPERLAAWCSERGVVLVEDNAHGFGAAWNGKPLGSFGLMSTVSFHETKNLQCGEGGALLTTSDEVLGRAEIVREKGTNRSRFFRGLVDKYTWVGLGSSFLPSELLAAFLLGQLEAIDDIQTRRHAVWDAYRQGLADWASDRGVRMQAVPALAQHPAHLFALLMPSPADQRGLIEHCRMQSVGATFHYQPLSLSPAGQRFGTAAPDGCPVSKAVAERIVRLPLWPGMSEQDVDHVLSVVSAWEPRRSPLNG